MGTILAFPADARARRGAAARPSDAEHAMGHLVILPVIRIERHDDAPTTTDRGPEEGAPRRRRRRARS